MSSERKGQALDLLPMIFFLLGTVILIGGIVANFAGKSAAAQPILASKSLSDKIRQVCTDKVPAISFSLSLPENHGFLAYSCEQILSFESVGPMWGLGESTLVGIDGIDKMKEACETEFSDEPRRHGEIIHLYKIPTTSSANGRGQSTVIPAHYGAESEHFYCVLHDFVGSEALARKQALELGIGSKGEVYLSRVASS